MQDLAASASNQSTFAKYISNVNSTKEAIEHDFSELAVVSQDAVSYIDSTVLTGLRTMLAAEKGAMLGNTESQEDVPMPDYYPVALQA